MGEIVHSKEEKNNFLFCKTHYLIIIGIKAANCWGFFWFRVFFFVCFSCFNELTLGLRERTQDHMLCLEILLSRTMDEAVTTCGITFSMLLPTVYIKAYVRKFLHYKIYMLEMSKDSVSQ